MPHLAGRGRRARWPLKSIPGSASTVAAAALAFGCLASPPSRPSRTAGPVSLILVGDLRGTLEPCGCTSDPVGGVYRLSTVVRRARAVSSGTTVVAGGDLLFEHARVGGVEAAQDIARARALVEALSRIGLWVSALGELDNPAGSPALSNLVPGASFAFLSPDGAATRDRGSKRVRSVGGVRIAAIAVAPGASAEETARALRRAGAQVVLLMVHGNRAQARQTAHRTPNADFVLVGHATDPRQSPEAVGGVTLLEVGPLGRHAGVLELHGRRPGQRFVDGEPNRSSLRFARLRLEQARRRLITARKRGAPPARLRFYKRVESLARRMVAQQESTLRARRPRGRNHFRWRLIRLDRRIPDDPAVVALRDRYKARLRAINLAQGRQLRAPPPRRGLPRFQGNDSCAGCHPEALAFWRKTAHARAWKTLVKGRSDYDLKCISCHMTGYLRPGGSSLTERPELRDVGCEACHGPGSLHEDAPDARKKQLISRSVPESVCLGCHNPEHSDLFAYDAYLKRVLGPGHGRPLPSATKAAR